MSACNMRRTWKKVVSSVLSKSGCSGSRKTDIVTALGVLGFVSLLFRRSPNSRELVKCLLLPRKKNTLVLVQIR